MPELPEVETVKRGLEMILPVGTKVQSAKPLSPRLRTPLSSKAFAKLKNQTLLAYERRAKYLLLYFDKNVLLSHLGMTGTWRLEDTYKDFNQKKHDHFVLSTSVGELVYNDPRRFGILELEDKAALQQSSWLSHLGPEPFIKEGMTAQYLFEKSRRRSVALKTFIMDQKVVVGVGNIYASEALFMAGISPVKAAGTISLEKYELLVRSIEKIIKKAIKAGGTTLKDFRQAGGSEGYFQNDLLVYGKAKQPCPTCGRKIRSQIIGGRNSFWCTRCQR